MKNKGLTRKYMRRLAAKFIREEGKFILLFDIVDSETWGRVHGYGKMYGLLRRFLRQVNRQFSRFLTTGSIGLRNEKNFRGIIGDGGGGYVASIAAVDEIPALAEKMLPFKLHWAVARDEWDERLKKILN